MRISLQHHETKRLGRRVRELREPLHVCCHARHAYNPRDGGMPISAMEASDVSPSISLRVTAIA
jgi:hypothetical protein